jgi:hypothetical protein
MWELYSQQSAICDILYEVLPSETSSATDKIQVHFVKSLQSQPLYLKVSVTHLHIPHHLP